MPTVKNNNIFEKTSFLGGNSSEFIEELYSQYVQNPKSISKECATPVAGICPKAWRGCAQRLVTDAPKGSARIRKKRAARIRLPVAGMRPKAWRGCA